MRYLWATGVAKMHLCCPERTPCPLFSAQPWHGPGCATRPAAARCIVSQQGDFDDCALSGFRWGTTECTAEGSHGRVNGGCSPGSGRSENTPYGRITGGPTSCTAIWATRFVGRPSVTRLLSGGERQVCARKRIYSYSGQRTGA